jgi:hypothetical protein
MACGEVASIDQIQLEGTPEDLHGGIVVTVVATAYEGDQIRGGQVLTEASGGVLDPSIGVEEQFPWRGTSSSRSRRDD